MESRVVLILLLGFCLGISGEVLSGNQRDQSALQSAFQNTGFTINQNSTDDRNSTDNQTDNDGSNKFIKIDNTIKAQTVCQTGHCSHKCTAVEGKPVCSCPDERMYLRKDGKNCAPKSCSYWGNKGKKYYSVCGDNASCSKRYDSKYGGMLPSCACKTPNRLFNNGPARYVLRADGKSCRSDTRYKTCSWPVKVSCDWQSSSGCVAVNNYGSNPGSYPRCNCKKGYKLDSNNKDCLVDDPCQINNGGCAQTCRSNSRTKVVTCSCYQDFTTNDGGQTCDLKSCSNGNSGCSDGCTQLDKNNFYCHCPKGWALNSDGKTCYDYDECAGFHGCDHKCTPDGKGWFSCECDPGFVLQDNGYSCRVSDKCQRAGCSQHCNPTLGTCYCDATHQLDSDGKSCVDKDECKLGTSGCQDLCENTDGGFTCSCTDPKARLSNDLKSCVLDTCKEVNDILYGSTSCTHGHADKGTMKIGDYCRFSCNKGFKLIGAQNIHCTKTGYDYVEPHCQDINECDDPTRCSGDETCVNNPGGFQCVCKGGFSGQSGSCKDGRGPEVRTCPDDAFLTLPADADTVRFTWKKPTVFDATDKQEDISCTNCPTSEEMQVGVGQKSIRYIYSDKAGNRALCSFKVKVVDITPPVFTGCPNNTVFQRGVGNYPLEEFVKSIGASDNSGEKPIVSHDKPPSFRNPGFRTVNYFARDSSDNQATCTFYVNISVSECAPLTPPANGYFDNNCDDWHVGNTCEPKCNDGYTFFSHPSNTSYRYQCGSDGTWTPGADTVPDCYAVEQPSEAEITFVSRYMYKECPTDDPNQKDALVGMLIEMFKDSNSAFCFLLDSCKLATDPKIECDKAAGTFTVTLKTDENYAQIPNHQGMVVEFKKKIRAEMNRLKSSGAFFALIIPPRSIVTPLLNQNGLPISPNFRLSCESGSRAIMNQCVACPASEKC